MKKWVMIIIVIISVVILFLLYFLFVDNDSDKIKIEEIPRLTAYEGAEFEYQIQAEGNNLKYKDYTDIFDIDENTGKINFIPDDIDPGDYEFLIEVSDNKGNSQTIVLIIDIELNLDNGLE